MLDAKIETFLTVVELGSYTAAGEALHLTQPAVTGHIRRLEAHYGLKLIDSSRRSVRLTQAGERLYQYMRSLRANQEAFTRTLAGHAAPLRIGATLSIADFYLPALLICCLTAGGARFRVRVENTGRLLDLLGRGELDCAFVEGIFDSGLYDARVFRRARFRPAAAADHPLAGGRVTLAQLHAYPLALREEGSGTREVLAAWLRQQNDSFASFSNLVELGSFVLLKELLLHSQAVTFLYEAVARREVEAGQLCFLALEDCALAHPLHFVCRRGDPRAGEYDALYRALMDD